MSPQRFNRILLLAVVFFIGFTVVAYAASAPETSIISTHNQLYPKLQESEMVWETVVRQVVMALVRR